MENIQNLMAVKLSKGEVYMIKKIHEKDIAECVNVIKESFITVADELGYTVDNAPRFTAFATTEDR